jgi:uncharacterized protein with HEPN domain
MIDAIDRIETYAVRGRAAFEGDELIQNWFVRHLQILGEAACALPESTRQAAPKIEWRRITGMRHVLVHDYFDIDREVVWNTVEKDLTPLRAALVDLLDLLPDNSSRT